MKKVLLFIFALLTCTSLQAQNTIPFNVEHVPQKPVGNQGPKSPVTLPVVYLDDYTLTFETNHPEYVLYIKDENDVVVYSYYVAASTNTVVLPSTLSGSYRIELVTDDWLFWGYILL